MNNILLIDLMVQILFGEDFSTLFLLHHLCLQDSAKSTKERNFYCKKGILMFQHNIPCD